MWQVYDYAAKPIINGVPLLPDVSIVGLSQLKQAWTVLAIGLRLRGFNGTVFAYGGILRKLHASCWTWCDRAGFRDHRADIFWQDTHHGGPS